MNLGFVLRLYELEATKPKVSGQGIRNKGKDWIMVEENGEILIQFVVDGGSSCPWRVSLYE